jgi:VanZ family protein
MKYGRLLARLAYVAVIAFATVAEPTLPAGGSIVTDRLSGALDPGFVGRDLVDALRNLLLFAGWGAVWTVTSPVGRAWPIVGAATATGALLSAAAEAFQLVSPTRTPSVLDLLSNTAGAFLGALGVAVLVVLLRASRGQRSYVGMPMALFATGYGGGVLFEALSPVFRQERLPGSWGPPQARLMLALQNFTPSLAGFAFLDIVLFAPAAAFAVAALGEMGMAYRKAAVVVSVGGVALAVLAETMRGALGYPIESGAMLAHSLGFGLGALAAARGLPRMTRSLRGAARPLALWCVYAVLLGLWALRPFYPEYSFASIAHKLPIVRFIPLQAYRDRVDVVSAADAAIPVLMLVPLGALMVAWPLRRRGWAAGLLPAIYLMTILEVAQILVAGRFFDITDLLVAAAALALGWHAAQRAGYQPHGEALSAMPRPPDAPAAARARRFS